MKKILLVSLGLLMMFLTSSVMACENCDCGCENGEKCNCKKEVVKDCDCDCHKGEKCTKADCNCVCHKKCNCKNDCKCKGKKHRRSIKNLFKRNQIKCNCEE